MKEFNQVEIEHILSLTLKMSTPWKHKALQVIRFQHGFIGQGVDMRKIVEAKIGPCQPSNWVWGSVIKAAFKAGYLIRTDKFEYSKEPSSHKCWLPVLKSKDMVAG